MSRILSTLLCLWLALLPAQAQFSGSSGTTTAAQVYTALTSATILLSLTLAANIATTRYTVNTVYLSLTTGQGTAATCDVYLTGTDLT